LLSSHARVSVRVLAVGELVVLAVGVQLHEQQQPVRALPVLEAIATGMDRVADCADEAVLGERTECSVRSDGEGVLPAILGRPEPLEPLVAIETPIALRGLP